MRRSLVAGNWKMNPPRVLEAHGLADAIRRSVEIAEGVDVVVCPPTICLDLVRNALMGSAIGVGAQTMHWETSGAFTGETSPAMLAGEVGQPIATHVILGHSERREYDGETDEAVARKVSAALDHGLIPIVCIGERLEERQAGQAEAVVTRQLDVALSRVAELRGRRLAIAYEPVWAIGTGVAASPSDAQLVAQIIRARLGESVGVDPAGDIPILYGGSVTGENAQDFFERDDIDGALVGGASLRADEFAAIVRAAASAR